VVPRVLPTGTASLLLQITAPEVSVMIKVPALALFALFVICAVKAEKVGDIPRPGQATTRRRQR